MRGRTPEGGIAVPLINKTGAPSIKGTIVEADSSVDEAFSATGATEFMPIGVVYENGVVDGSECLVVVAGIVDVLLEDGTAATRGYWVKTSDTQVGRVDATLSDPPGGGLPQLDEHSREVGHCIQSAGAGIDVLASIIMHFN